MLAQSRSEPLLEQIVGNNGFFPEPLLKPHRHVTEYISLQFARLEPSLTRSPWDTLKPLKIGQCELLLKDNCKFTKLHFQQTNKSEKCLLQQQWVGGT